MNLESRLSGVPVFLRPDKLELLSRDDDKDPALNPLETEGDRADGEESFETVFLIPLLPLLSNDVEVILLEKEEETDDAGLTEDFLTLSCLVMSDPVDVFKLLPTGETGTDFLLASETLVRVEALATTGGNELLLCSGRDRLTGSEPEGLAVFFPATEPALICLLSGNPPVLFRLATGTAFKLFNDALTVGFITVELDSWPVLESNLFLAETVAAETFEDAGTLGFADFATLFVLSDEPAGVCFSAIWGFSTGSSPGGPRGSSILVHQLKQIETNNLIRRQPNRSQKNEVTCQQCTVWFAGKCRKDRKRREIKSGLKSFSNLVSKKHRTWPPMQLLS